MNIYELEKKAQELLNTIQLIRVNSFSKDENYDNTIDDFYKNLNGLSSFLKSMRKRGYFGKSPQSQKDLDEQDEMIRKLQEIKVFVERNFKKNKERVIQ